MKKNIIFAVCLAAALASCNRIETPEYQAMSLDINVTTAAETKAVVNGTTLPSGSSVGLFVADESGVTYDGVSVANIRYTGTGEGASQQWAAQSDIMLSATKATLRGYYPYSESVTDISAIPIQATSDVQDDWMWATPVNNLNNKNNSATLTMNHALAAVRLSIVRGSYSGVAEVTSVAFKSESAATDAVLDATDGSLSSVSGANTRYESTEVFTIGDEKKSFDFITVPAGVSAPVAIEVMVNGSKMVAESDAVLLETGNLYEYTLAVGTEGVCVNSMNVTEWSVEQKGTVKLEPGQGGSADPDTPAIPDIDFDGTVPDPFVEWARIQHRNGTLYTAEEWLAAETAGTVADADANGVVVLYSRYAVCPHVIHPKYSTNAMEWSSNTSVEVPGVTTASDKATAQLDVNGKANTDAILAAVAAGTIEDAPAAQYCVDVTFADGKKGYLPAAGELKAWFDNKTAVNACMDAIGGDQIDTTDSWSSTQCSALYAWYWAYYNDALYMGNHSNDTDFYVRSVVAFEYN